MALIKCAECGNEISNTAKVCPKCGAKNKKRPMGFWGWLFVVFVVIPFLVAVATSVWSTNTESPGPADNERPIPNAKAKRKPAERTSPTPKASSGQRRPIGHFDGITLGMSVSETEEKLKHQEGIGKIDGTHYLERVPGSTTYRYAISRGDTRNSEVELSFMNGRLSKIVDASGGPAVNTLESATATFAEQKAMLAQRWGSPLKSVKDEVVWEYNGEIGALYLERPSNAYGLPNLLLTIERSLTKK